MPRSKKTENGKSASEATPAFEESLVELQQIVCDLEDGSLGLEESMRRFEKGIELLRLCYQTLERAEQKIELLTGFDGEGNPLTRPFDATATIDQPDQPAGRRKRPAAERAELDGQPDECDPDGTLF